MGESAAAEILRKTTGMWWPAADSGKLRAAASAWKTMATGLDNVTAPANSAAQSVIEGNHGTAIDAFHTFWNRYYDGGQGWLPQTAQACRQMAKALDDFADEVDKAIHTLEEEAAVVGATLVVGTALAIFTAGISEAVADTATAGIIAAADALGVTMSETVASIAGTTFTGAAFGAVESVAVDAAVAQPIRIAFGDGGFSGAELLSAAEAGGLGGAAGGALSRAARALSEAAEDGSRTLAAIGKISTGIDTMAGRMVTGAALGAGQDALFNDGHISPLDVAAGAIGGAAARPGKIGRRRSVEDDIDTALAEHPDVASVVKKLTADTDHPLDLTRAINDPARRGETLTKIRELADGRLLSDRTLEEYGRDNPGSGPLFEPTAHEINTAADGQSRKDAYVAGSKEIDPARSITSNPDAHGSGLVDDYAQRLKADVHPAVRSEVASLATKFDGATMSIRTKNSEAILDKVTRMATGSEARPPRPGYQVGDVIDAVGARITTRDTKQLEELLRAVKERYGVGDGGRILELENMYAEPKSAKPWYRLIALTIATEVNERPYTYELQLTTQRASITADLDHNAIYKPYIEITDTERDRISHMVAEAAALDREEIRRNPR